MPHIDLPSRRFEPRIYGVGAWTSHLHFAYDLVATLKPALLVELGVDRGESYFAFCQSAAENQTGTRCFGIDTWRGDQHAGGYDETTFAQVSEHNRANYESFSTLMRSGFDDALSQFESDSIDVLHLDGLHTEAAVRHDVDSWLPKLRPGGILLLHDVDVRSKEFGVWKVWAELQARGRSWTFHDGPGLAVWQKPPASRLPGFLEQLLAPPNEANATLAEYYTERAAGDAGEDRRSIGATARFGTRRSRSKQSSRSSTQPTDRIARKIPFTRASATKDGKRSESNCRLRAGAAPLRIDFVSALTTIEIASIRADQGSGHLFRRAEEKRDSKQSRSVETSNGSRFRAPSAFA